MLLFIFKYFSIYIEEVELKIMKQIMELFVTIMELLV